MTSINRRTILTAAAAGAGSLASQAQAKAQEAAPLPLTPTVEEGPFYLPGAPTRGAISGNRQGAPIALRIRVLDETGAPMPGAQVDVWHCDATGLYSGFGEGEGQPLQRVQNDAWFLRGVQTTGDDGMAGFRTVYPGWYPGRTTHVHFKIWRRGVVLLTSQMFLPDGLSEFLYTQAKAYARDHPRDTLNRTDGIAIAAGDRVAAALSENEDRYTVDLTAVVDRAARPAPDPGRARGPFAGGMPPRPFGPPPPERAQHGPPPFGPPGFGPPGPGPSGSGPPFGPPPLRPVLSAEERLRLLIPRDPA